MDVKMLDKLDMMIALGAKDCGNDDVDMLDNLDTSTVALDKSFHRKRVRIVEKHKHHSTVLAIKKMMLCLIAAVIIVSSLGFTTIMAIEPMRKAVFEVVIEWHKNYIAIRYEQDTETPADPVQDGEGETTTNPVILPPATIEEARKPTSIASDIIEDVVIQNKTFVCIDYYKGEKLAYTFNQMTLSQGDMYIDNEGAIVGTVDINGNEGTLIQHAGFSAITIIWSDGEYLYQIITQITPLNELLEVCKSVQ